MSAGKGDTPRKVHGPTFRKNHDEIFRKSPRVEYPGKIDLETGRRCIGIGCYQHINVEESRINELREGGDQ